MGKSTENQPGRASSGDIQREQREARQAEALRKNLQRRKQQVRGRRDAADQAAGRADESDSPASTD